MSNVYLTVLNDTTLTLRIIPAKTALLYASPALTRWSVLLASLQPCSIKAYAIILAQLKLLIPTNPTVATV